MKLSESCVVAVLTALTALAPGVAPDEGGGDEGKGLPAAGTEGGPTHELVGLDARQWLAGRELFVRAFEKNEGLGPVFNAPSCGTCHNKPALGGAGELEFNVGTDDDDGFPPYSLHDAPPGARQRIIATLMALEARDDARREAEEEVPRAVGIQTPSLLGLGLLDTIFENKILENEDPDDRDGDGVRGVASRVDVGRGYVEIGRFGWRAQAASMDDFVRGACGGELGLTVPFSSRGFGQSEDDDFETDPELSWREVADLAFYCRELAVPPRGGRGQEPAVVQGEELFTEIGCTACHVPSLPGRYGPVPLYSDLLLHEVFVKDRLLRKGQEETAEPLLFRTPPLWGIGKTAPYMHNGSAPTLELAIEAHGGEAEETRARWRALDDADRQAILEFLADL